MAASKKYRAAEEFRLAQACYAQAMMHRTIMRNTDAPWARALRRERAAACIESARYHLAQCGAILGLNAWPT